MSGPARYSMGWIEPTPDGAYVRFADVEEALRDRDRLTWLMPCVSGETSTDANARHAALLAGIRQGLRGNELVDVAMAACAV